MTPNDLLNDLKTPNELLNDLKTPKELLNDLKTPRINANQVCLNDQTIAKTGQPQTRFLL